MSYNQIHQNDFKIFNNWTVDRSGSRFSTGEPYYLIDQSTQKRYLNEDKFVVGFKCFLLTIGTIPVHSIASVVNSVARFCLAGSALFTNNPGQNLSLKQKFITCLKHLAHIALSPLIIVALTAAAIFGIFSPYNGRKLYASLERFQYGSFILAPCFQPDPQRHLMGSDLNTRNGF